LEYSQSIPLHPNYDEEDVCVNCRKLCHQDFFSLSQWRKRYGSKCISCVRAEQIYTSLSKCKMELDKEGNFFVSDDVIVFEGQNFKTLFGYEISKEKAIQLFGPIIKGEQVQCLYCCIQFDKHFFF